MSCIYGYMASAGKFIFRDSTTYDKLFKVDQNRESLQVNRLKRKYVAPNAAQAQARTSTMANITLSECSITMFAHSQQRQFR